LGGFVTLSTHPHQLPSPPPLPPTCRVKYAVNTETGKGVAIKILDKEKIQKQNMGAQIKKEVGGG
jgi:hypothetical protein